MSGRWRLLGGVTILAVVGWHVGSDAFLDGLRALDATVLALGLAIGVVTTVACAYRWRLVAGELGVPVGLRDAVAACYRAQLLNAVLPGGVLGDVHRGVVHGRPTGETGRALRAVGWERFAGQVVQAGLAALVLVLLPSPVRPLLPWVVAAAVVLAAVVALVPVVRDDLRAALLVRRAWPGVVVASAVAIAGYATTYVLAVRAVGVDAPLEALLPLVMVILVAAGLPLNVAGWGPREGMAAWAFGAVGLGAADGVAASVAYGVIALVATLPGLAVLVLARPVPAGEGVHA